MPRPLMHPLPGNLSEQVRERLRRILAHFEDMRGFTWTPGALLPPIDLCEMPEAIVVRVELPGVRPEHIRLTMTDNALKIEGHKERAAAPDHEPGNAPKYLCLERAFGGFTRTLVLHWPVEVSRITARIHNGVLTIHLPKALSCGREFVIPIGE